MRPILAALSLALLLGATPVLAQDAPSENPASEAAPATAPGGEEQAMTPEQEAAARAQLEAQAKEFYDSLNRQTGLISVAGGKAQLNVPETHYFLGPDDARRVLVDVWGNPPGAAQGIEGMIFPAGANPMLAGVWGAVVEYSSDGYVSDKDAASLNYTDLLHKMQDDAKQANEERRRQHYPEIEIVDWAEAPHYDAQSHKLYWAKHLRFNDAQYGTEDTLNYDVRVLGRAGYLQLEFISGITQLEDINASIPAVLTMSDFTDGNRYADYQEGVDPKAAYGIGGLIAGGAALALAQKAGLFAILLKFGKVIIVGIGLAFAAVARFFGGMFRRKIETGGGDPPAAA